MITYYELGPDKRLNEIVMAGSHDAGVTLGKDNTQTQDLDIHGQATAGVRLFDIRITGAVVKEGGASKVTALKAYHGVGPTGKKSGVDLRSGEADKVKVKSMWGGAYGMTLSKILGDASKFVSENGTEFLILKFDKCHNWLQIAEACIAVLGNTLYKEGGNLNNKTLRDLRGKSSYCFPPRVPRPCITSTGFPREFSRSRICTGIPGRRRTTRSTMVCSISVRAERRY